MRDVATAKLGPEGAEIEVEQYLLDSVTIVPENIDEEFVRVAADYSYWVERYSIALLSSMELEGGYDKIRAQVHLEQRERAAKEAEIDAAEEVAQAAAAAAAGEKKPVKKRSRGGGAPTVDDLKALVVADERVCEARRRWTIAHVEKERLRLQVSAVSARKDALQSLGAKIRAEMEADPMVRERHAAMSRGR